MSDLVPGLPYSDFVAEAVRHSTEASFRASGFFARHGAALDALLLMPRLGGSVNRPEKPDGLLRVLHWNIEKGKTLDRLKRHFANDPAFSRAQVITLNEVDLGMARSGPNADVITELAAAHGSRFAYVPNYIECTCGLPGEAPPGIPDERGLHGIAILSRLPILDVQVHALPTGWDYFSFREKRFGGRRGLYVRLAWNEKSIIVATVHLEMRCDPATRARQFRAFLDGLDFARRFWGNAPTVITGDWNTHTFRRGNLDASVREFLRIVSTKPEALDRELAWPLDREPLFADLRAAGFEFAGTNERAPTAGQNLGRVEDLGALPVWLGELLLRASRLKGRTLRMRLDWIAVKGFEARAAVTLPAGPPGEPPLSDHLPVSADLTVTDRPGLLTS